METIRIIMGFFFICFVYRAEAQNFQKHTSKKSIKQELKQACQPSSFIVSSCIEIDSEDNYEVHKVYLSNTGTEIDCTEDVYSPHKNAVEIIEKRTETSKYYVDKDTAEKIYVVASIGALHYKKNDEWITIDERIKAMGNGIYEARSQEEPVGFDVNKQASFIKSIQETVFFNNWTLYGTINGKETFLANADWSNYIIESDGMYIKNIFPGIDAEMITGRGTVKTNFLIKENAFPHVTLFVFKDTFSSNSGFFNAANNTTSAYYMSGETAALFVNTAVAYELNNLEKSTKNLEYSLLGNELSLSIDALYINTNLQNGIVIIDPLVSTINSIAKEDITGSRDCGSPNTACSYSMDVPFPAETTLTGIYEKFGISTVGAIPRKYAAYAIVSQGQIVNFMADPEYPDTYNTPGAIASSMYTNITDFFLRAMPPPSCTSYGIPFSLRMYNHVCYGSTSCTELYQKAIRPFVIMLEGRKIRLNDVNFSISICKGESSDFFAQAAFGVPPYTYMWSNAAGFTKEVTVSPMQTTQYNVTITDQCGNSVYDTVTVNVKPYSIPQTPIASSNSPVCEGETLLLTASTIPNVIYQWRGPSTFFSNNQNPSITNPNKYESGDYIVRVLSDDGCWSHTDTVNVEVKNKDAVVSIISEEVITCDGTRLHFLAVPTDGGSDPSYQWKVNGVNVGKDTSVYSSVALVPGDVVSCEMVSNAGDCISLDVVVSNKITIEKLTNSQIKDIDGNIYNTIIIGAQTWLKENLKTTRYNDGTSIPHVTDHNAWRQRTEGAYCNWNNIANNHEENNHGRFYNFYAVETGKLCPNGWHVPSVSEWTILLNYVKNKNYAAPAPNFFIGKPMASTTGWIDPGENYSVYAIGNNPELNNNTGFSLVPTGSRFASFWTWHNGAQNVEALLWASDPSVTCLRAAATSPNGLYTYPVTYKYGKYAGMPVRCIKDAPQPGTIPISLYADTASVCEGDSVTLTALVCDGTAPFTYSWNSSMSADSAIVVFPTATDTMFTVKVTDANNFSNIDTIFINVSHATYFDTLHVACDSFILNNQVYTQSGTYTQTLTNARGCDSIIMLQLTINESSSHILYPTKCDDYTLNNQTYTQSGTYMQTLTNELGCDSVITIHLEIMNEEDAIYEFSETVCDTFTLNGTEYTESGDYTQGWKTVAGCDSTIILHLTVLSSTDTITRNICGGSYTLNRQTYTQTGIYTQSFTNSYGCDSIIVLDLTLSSNNAPSREITIRACNSYSLYGEIFTKSGTYTRFIPNVSGCDSLIIINLEILKSSSETMATICKGEHYMFSGNSYSTEGTYSIILTNNEGCDSVATLYLYVSNPDSSFSNASICEGESFWFNNKAYYEKGKYSVNVQNKYGCDSIASLLLDVKHTSSLVTNAVINEGESYVFGDSVYTKEGIYINYFINENGCESTTTLNLYVENPITGPYTLYVPNAFAPNSPANEVSVFKPKGMHLSTYKIWVFDKWGNIVWYSNKLTDSGFPEEAWNGKYNSKLLPAGSYIWKIEAEFLNGEHKTIFGNVVLLK